MSKQELIAIYKNDNDIDWKDIEWTEPIEYITIFFVRENKDV